MYLSLINHAPDDVNRPVLCPLCVQTLCSAVVQVYGADRSCNWVKRCCGVACLVKDNPQRSYFIRVFDIKVNGTILERKHL